MQDLVIVSRDTYTLLCAAVGFFGAATVLLTIAILVLVSKLEAK